MLRSWVARGSRGSRGRDKEVIFWREGSQQFKIQNALHAAALQNSHMTKLPGVEPFSGFHNVSGRRDKISKWIGLLFMEPLR
jgi:hypothetical protein